jgi:uncharacterized membrane protein YidH (DUF202 family)
VKRPKAVRSRSSGRRKQRTTQRRTLATNDEAHGSPALPEASRRTYFAEERTLLAWWRTGIATAAVALAVGAFLPKLDGIPRARFVALGVGYGVLALIFVIGGTVRDKLSRRALKHGDFAQVPDWFVDVVTVYISVLVVLTVVALL